MAEETKIGIKMEEETKPLKKLCEKLEESISHEFNKGIENVDVMEMKEAIDMLKDLYEAKKYMLESCYFKSVVEAMEEYGEDEEMEDDGRRGYRGQPRSESGRFMSRGDGRRSNRGGRGRGRRGYESPMMYDEDWEEMQRNRDFDLSQGRMYYSGGQSSSGSSSGMSGGSQGGQGGNSGYSDSRYENAKRGYQESKEMKDGSHMKSLEEYSKELTEDVMGMVKNMDSGEKQMIRTKLQTLASKIQ